MSKTTRIILLSIVLLAIIGSFLFFRKTIKTFAGAPGDTVELVFELDKKFEFGEYYFDLDNGPGATYPLCYCLTEKNTYPPDCFGDVKYIYNNIPGTMCVPLQIGTGRCSAKVMSSSSYATRFLIPLEYQWTKPMEKIVIGIRVPLEAPDGAKMVVAVTVKKKDDRGKLVIYRNYEQAVIAKHRSQ